MRRRELLSGLVASGVVARMGVEPLLSQDNAAVGHATYKTIADAIKSPREKYAILPAITVGTRSKHSDYMATVDVDPASKTYSQVVGRLSMPIPGDELHHFGWNACSSCYGERPRTHLIVPGLASSNIYIIDASEPKKLKLIKTIPGNEIANKTNLSTPHTVHCRADGVIMISMLGDANGEAPGGFLEISEDYKIIGRWEKSTASMNYNYDYWYQPRHDVMVSSEWAAPNTVRTGFHLQDVEAGKYGRHLNFWSWSDKRIVQSLDLGPGGLIPLEVRFHHDPDSTHGFVGAALSSAIFHWQKLGDQWTAEKIVQVDPVETEGWPFPLPGLITDVILSLDDKYLYFSSWLHGDIRQYDVSNPSRPRLTGQVWLGGLIGEKSELAERGVTGGPQMIQLSRDGQRLYVTSSLYSVWDNQFYPQMAEQGSWMTQIDCDTESGGMKLNQNFFVDFGKEPQGPARAHEIRFPAGDSTSDIWV